MDEQPEQPRTLGNPYPRQVPVPPSSPPYDLPGPPRTAVPLPPPTGLPVPGPPPTPPSRHPGAAFLAAGALAVLAGLLGPRLGIWYHSASTGAGISLDTVRAVCSSGAGALVSAGDAAVRTRCSHADLYAGVMEAVLIAGCALLGAGVLAWARRRPAAG